MDIKYILRLQQESREFDRKYKLRQMNFENRQELISHAVEIALQPIRQTIMTGFNGAMYK
jgi:hypothetical protein